MMPGALKCGRAPNSPVRTGVGAILSASMKVALLAAFLVLGWGVAAQQRFPPPDFESGHKLPETTTPAARALAWEYVDVAVLFAGLVVATWLIYRKRSRAGLIGLSLFSLAYFGFWRRGCICAIGSVQNVALALSDSSYVVPITAGAFFILPLFFALFAGRAFCAAVCPHGALQDLVLVKPLKVPSWLEHALGVLPFVYLGAGVLFAATGSAFIFCQYDPFVPIFRLSGRTLMVLTGIGLLLLGLFVGRPYCRFLCPLGALLKLGSSVAKWRVRVTPDYCTQCRLCEASCPFGAMREPDPGRPEARWLGIERRRLALLVVIVPVLVGAGALLGTKFADPASRLHPTVRLAERLVQEKDKPSPTGTLTPEQLALERARREPLETLTEAAKVRSRFRVGAVIFGGWVGLVIGLKLVSVSIRRRRVDYEPDRGECLACARCFEFCPNELVRRGILPALPVTETAAAGGIAQRTSPIQTAMQSCAAGQPKSPTGI